jgi:hypothetical protein
MGTLAAHADVYRELPLTPDDHITFCDNPAAERP